MTILMVMTIKNNQMFWIKELHHLKNKMFMNLIKLLLLT